MAQIISDGGILYVRLFGRFLSLIFEQFETIFSRGNDNRLLHHLTYLTNFNWHVQIFGVKCK